MMEKWRPVLGFEGFYEVSDLGRIRSLRRDTKRGVRGGSIMRPMRAPNGYLTVVLTATAIGKRERHYVHELVLEAFVSRRPEGMDACHHPDPDRTNCALRNLRWDTRRGNFADKAKQGTQTHGEFHPVAKLSEAQAREILRLRGSMSQAAIGRLFGVTGGLVHLIHKRRLWKHLELPA